jgi:hypothetical protein
MGDNPENKGMGLDEKSLSFRITDIACQPNQVHF